MGGEPLLNPNYVDYYIETRKLFPNSKIVLVSNGSLLRNVKDEDIDILNKNNIELCVSDYGINIDRIRREAAIRSSRSIRQSLCEYETNKSPMF